MKVRSDVHWHDTGRIFDPNTPITFEATGEWTDWYIPSGPEGYERWYLAPYRPLRRLPTAPWFALVGAFDKDLSTAFEIGTSKTLPQHAGGRLYVFANDVSFMYFNNKGEIDLTINGIP